MPTTVPYRWVAETPSFGCVDWHPVLMKVCILGEGGRERAFAWTADKFDHEVYVVPGNADIPWRGTGRAVPALRWGGVAFIAGGIFLVSRTPHAG